MEADRWVERLRSGIVEGGLTVGVVGLGYVGLPLALAFSRVFDVVGYDVDVSKVEMLRSGRSYINYIDDGEIRSAKRFIPTNDYRLLRDADFIIIAVPTPLGEGKVPDLSYVEGAARTVGRILRKGHFVILESTTYPGTTEEVLVPILEEESGLKAVRDFGVAYSPERIDPGNTKYRLEDVPKVVGGLTPELTELAAELYAKIIKRVVKVSNPRTAEAVKMLENIFRNVNIALVNELALIFEKMGIDIWEVIEAAKTKPYGFMPFYPGPGVGGHCIPIDPYYLSYKAKQLDIMPRFIEIAGEVNDTMPIHAVNLAEKGLRKIGKTLRNSNIAVLGLAYKADVNDPRESPALKIIKELERRKANIKTYDPYIKQIKIGDKEYRSEDNLEETLKWADAIILVTDHTQFKQQEFLKQLLSIDKKQAIIDCRNIIRREHIQPLRIQGKTIIRLGDGTNNA